MQIRERTEPDGNCLIWPMVLFLLLIPNLFWIWIDRSVRPWDPSWYGQVTVNLYLNLQASVSDWGHNMWTALPGRAPGLVWIGQLFVPIGLWFGRADFGLLLCNWTLQFISAILTFRATRRLFDSQLAAIAATVFVCSGPLFVGMSHSYFTEPFQGVGIALFMTALCEAERRPLVRTALLLTLAGIVAMFGRISSPLYLACPALLFAVHSKRRSGELKSLKLGPVDLALALLVLLGVGVFGVWFAANRGAAFDHAFGSAFGKVATGYGSRTSLLNKVPLWGRQFLLSFVHPALRLPLLGVLGWAGWARVKRKTPPTWSDLVAAASAAEVVFALLIFCLSVNEISRFTFPLFPCVAIVLAWTVTWLPPLGRNVAWLAAAVQFALVQFQAFGIVPPSTELSPYLIPLDQEGEQLAQLRHALQLTCNSADGSRTFAVGLETPYFNADSLSFYSALDSIRTHLKCSYLNLGVAEDDPDRAWRNLVARQPGAILFLRGELARVNGADPFNLVSAAVYRKASTSTEFRLERVRDSPNLLVFRKGSGWRIRTAMLDGGGVWSELGHFGWRVHPATRSSPKQTVLDYDGDLPAHAVIGGRIQTADQRCEGVELDFEVAGEDRFSRKIARITAPVRDKDFSVALENAKDDDLAVHLRSVDAQRDNVDYCWLTIDPVTIGASNLRGAK